ncbi:Hypothetical protein A7982_03146 [Minicystis rosea]|nr:Hypothetical protein A7982_03146 [Minicystis rosea]
MPVRTKRWNDPAEPEDGFRLLVCRYRPRGVRKEDEPWDGWCSHLAPSPELHAAAYGKSGPPLSFAEYERRFREEMERQQRFWISGFAERVKRGETLTLLCSSACTDPERCHRTILKAMIEAAAAPPPPPAAAGIVRRRRA